MSRAKFVIDLILLLGEGKYITNRERLHDFKPDQYGLSRSTAWRVLKELERCGYVEKDVFHPSIAWLGQKKWRLTQQMKTRLSQVHIQRNEEFWRELDYILTFDDKTFEKKTREKVHAHIEKYKG